MVKPLTSLGKGAVTTALEDWFLEHGKPVSIRSDSELQFRREFSNLCKLSNIIHEKSSAHHHESNGHAESAVKDNHALLSGS